MSSFGLNFIYIYNYLNFTVVGCSGGHTLQLQKDNIFIHLDSLDKWILLFEMRAKRTSSAYDKWLCIWKIWSNLRHSFPQLIARPWFN